MNKQMVYVLLTPFMSAFFALISALVTGWFFIGPDGEKPTISGFTFTVLNLIIGCLGWWATYFM